MKNSSVSLTPQRFHFKSIFSNDMYGIATHKHSVQKTTSKRQKVQCNSKKVWACHMHLKKQHSWNIFIVNDWRGDFRKMSCKPVGSVWAWFVLASQTKLRLSNQSPFLWKTISDKRWERPLLLCSYIKKRQHNASWHMWDGGGDAK